MIGYCSGGRQAFLAACRLTLDAAVDCYGAFVMARPPTACRSRSCPVVDLAGNLPARCSACSGPRTPDPSARDVAELEQELARLGKAFEFHSYAGAGHGFFAVDRPSYRPEAAEDGWRRIWVWFGRHLAT